MLSATSGWKGPPRQFGTKCCRVPDEFSTENNILLISQNSSSKVIYTENSTETLKT